MHIWRKGNGKGEREEREEGRKRERKRLILIYSHNFRDLQGRMVSWRPKEQLQFMSNSVLLALMAQWRKVSDSNKAFN